MLAVDITADALAEAVDDANRGAAADGAGGRSCRPTSATRPHAADSVGAAVERSARLDVLANIAGILRTAHTHECSLDLWDQILRVNLTGTFLMCREAIPHLLDDERRIVNTASTSAQFGHPWMAAYAASKGGVAALTQTLAVEYAKQGLRVERHRAGQRHQRHHLHDHVPRRHRRRD